MLEKDFKNPGYDTHAVVQDALSTLPLLVKIYTYAGKKLKVWFKPTLVAMLMGVAFFFLQKNTSAEITPKAGSNLNQLPVIKETIVSGHNPAFQRPVTGEVSQRFWFSHQAIDIPEPTGTNVFPIADGMVEFAGWDTHGSGYLVTVRHEDGFSSHYAHLSKILVVIGSKVTLANAIGTVGSTGKATGSHLHLEMYSDGRLVDPENYLPKD